MGAFPERVVAELVRGAHEETISAGEIFYRGARHPETATLALIVDGLTRTFLQAQSGRQITIRYAGHGDVIGLPAVLLAGRDQTAWETVGGHHVHAEALRETAILKISPARLQRLAETEVCVAATLATALAQGTVETEQLLADGLFLSVRARVARHLMDLAERRDGRLVVSASHQEIANATGSVREVVSRTLVSMRDEGVVERRRGETIISDPAALHAIAAAG